VLLAVETHHEGRDIDQPLADAKEEEALLAFAQHNKRAGSTQSQ
jgi:hypothetical protein